MDRPISPKEIAQNIKLNPNSIRVNLHRLLKEGKVIKKFYGHYSISPIDGVGYDRPPRVQNLFVRAEFFQSGQKIRVFECDKGRVDEFPFGEDGAQVRIIYGWKRGNISWSVKAPEGLDLYGLRLVRSLVESSCGYSGYKDLNWMVSNFEFLWDHEGLRFEGVKSVTLQSFDTVLEKYYSKDDGLRKEIRASLPTELDHILALVQGGQPAFNLIQGVGVLSQKIDALVEAQKGQNRQLSNHNRLLEALVDSQTKLNDTLNDFIKTKE